MLHDKLRVESTDKSLLDKARQYASEYLDNSTDRHIYPTPDSLKELDIFDEQVPEHGATAHEILDLLHQHGSPNTIAQNSGRYFGFVNGGILPASIASKWLADVWDQNTATFVMSPICGKLESVTENWLKDLLSLPPQTVAGYVTGTTMSSYCGLLAGRYRLYKNQGYDINKQGMASAPSLRVITSAHTHSSVKRVISMLGFGLDHVEYVPVDKQGSIRMDQFPKLDASCLIILQAGNVNSGSFDPIDDICDLANEAGAWVHVDGAFGLWAAAVPQLSYLTKGMEKADSWSVDGHKTLNTPYDCGIVLCKDKEAVFGANHSSGSYLMLNENRDSMMYTPDMSRRARIVDLWSTIKSLGKSGIAEMVHNLHLRAKQFAKEIQEAGFIVPNEVVFNQVMVQSDNDSLTKAILQDVQQQGICWCGGSNWFDQSVIRISVCTWTTTEADISTTVASFKKARQRVV